MLWALALWVAFEPPPDAQEQVTRGVAPDDSVGKVKKGLICVPAGGLEAKDIAFPEAPDIGGRIVDPSARGYILSIRASVCSKFFGVGNAPSSKLAIKMAWHSGDANDCGRSFDGDIEAKGRDLRYDPTVMLDAIEQSYRRWREADPVGDC